jgi:sporulation protein YlmC with PRC-barrel domain
MTTADYLARGSGAPFKIISWLAFRFAVYAGVLGLVTILFLVGAAVYVLFSTAEIASVPSREFPSNPQPAPKLPTPSDPQSAPTLPTPENGLEGALVAGNPDLFGAPSVIGLEIVDPSNVPVGKISDIILDRNGKVQSMVIALNGYWLTRKYVVIPFKDFTFKPETIAGTKASDITRATVPYSRANLQALQPAPVLK